MDMNMDMDMDMDMKETLFNSTVEVCRRCGERTPNNQYGVCDKCDPEIEEEYYELYNIKTMENC